MNHEINLPKKKSHSNTTDLTWDDYKSALIKRGLCYDAKTDSWTKPGSSVRRSTMDIFDYFCNHKQKTTSWINIGSLREIGSNSNTDCVPGHPIKTPYTDHTISHLANYLLSRCDHNTRTRFNTETKSEPVDEICIENICDESIKENVMYSNVDHEWKRNSFFPGFDCLKEMESHYYSQFGRDFWLDRRTIII